MACKGNVVTYGISDNCETDDQPIWTSQVLVQDKYFSISAFISSFMDIAVVILLYHSFEKMGFSITYNTETFFSDEVYPWTMVAVLLF